MGARNVMAADEKGKEKGRPVSFYSRAFDELKKLELEEASLIEGVDEEIALIRLKLRELVEKQPENIELQLEAVNIIARLVKIQYQITRRQKKSLREAVYKVLTEVAVPLGISIGIKGASKKARQNSNHNN